MSLPPPNPGPPGPWGGDSGSGQWGQGVPPAGGSHWAQQPATPYGYGAPQNPYESEATPILVTGILSLVLCGLVGIYPWVKGNDLRNRATSAGWPEPSTAKVGRILGIVGSIIGMVQIAFGVIWMVLVFGIMGSATTY